jgi:hypothetical protein
MPLVLLALTACIHDLPWRDTADTGEPDAPPPTLPEVAAGGGGDGQFLRFEALVAATGTTRDGGTFFVQDPEGSAGLRVDLAFAGTIGPVSPGDVIDLQGYLDKDQGSPRLIVWEPDWLRRELPVDPPAATPLDLETASWAPNASRLVRVEGLTSLGCADAIGDVPLDGGLTLSDRFADLPGGIVEDSRIASVEGVIVEEWGAWRLWPVSTAAVQGVSGGRPCLPEGAELPQGALP